MVAGCHLAPTKPRSWIPLGQELLWRWAPDLDLTVSGTEVTVDGPVAALAHLRSLDGATVTRMQARGGADAASASIE